jgi:hypothetical protein
MAEMSKMIFPARSAQEGIFDTEREEIFYKIGLNAKRLEDIY